MKPFRPLASSYKPISSKRIRMNVTPLSRPIREVNSSSPVASSASSAGRLAGPSLEQSAEPQPEINLDLTGDEMVEDVPPSDELSSSDVENFEVGLVQPRCLHGDGRRLQVRFMS